MKAIHPTKKTLRPATLKSGQVAIVRDPETKRPLSIDGEEKEWTTYWRRRVKEGGVVIVENSTPSRGSSKTKTKVILSN